MDKDGGVGEKIQARWTDKKWVKEVEEQLEGGWSLDWCCVKVTWDYSGPIPQSHPGIWNSSPSGMSSAAHIPKLSLRLNPQSAQSKIVSCGRGYSLFLQQTMPWNVSLQEIWMMTFSRRKQEMIPCTFTVAPSADMENLFSAQIFTVSFSVPWGKTPFKVKYYIYIYIFLLLAVVPLSKEIS